MTQDEINLATGRLLEPTSLTDEELSYRTARAISDATNFKVGYRYELAFLLHPERFNASDEAVVKEYYVRLVAGGMALFGNDILPPKVES